jgi:Tol biopolymer transport system component
LAIAAPRVQSASAPGAIAYVSQDGLRTISPGGLGGDVLIGANPVFPDVVWPPLSPAWSPDGRQIAYSRGAVSSTGYGVTEIWVADADGSDQHMVASADPRSTALLPTWSPTGRRLAYQVKGAAGAADRPGIYVIRRDGTDKRWLHDGRWPSWSADGKLIAFRRMRLPRRLGVIRPDGTGFRSLPWGNFVRWLEFSPTDPMQLAYTATGRVDPATGDVVQGTRGVFTLDLQRGRNRQIPPDRIRGLTPLSEPALTWVPTGRRLAFIERSTDLITIRRNGTHKRRVLTLQGIDPEEIIAAVRARRA